MNDQVLSVALRPQRLSDMIGQGRLVTKLQAQVASGRTPRCFLLVGESGAGKTTLARILALSLQLPKERFGEPTAEDWARFPDYNIHEINSADLNKKEDVQEQTSLAKYRPTFGQRRVFILDECHKLSTAAQDLLLKPTEDCPPHMAWILATSDPGKLLITLKRRCTPFSMVPLDEETVLKLLAWVKKRAGVDKPIKMLASKLAEMGTTSPGFCVSAAELYFAGATITEACTATSAGKLTTELIGVCRSLVRGNWEELRGALKNITADEARGLRLMMMSYLRSTVINNGISKSSLACSSTILALSAYPPPENPAFLAWFTAILQTEVRKYQNK